MSEEAYKQVKEILDVHKTDLQKLSDEIWKNPELCYEEVFAHDYLTSFLEARGFFVQKSYKLPTAFKAEFCVSSTPQHPTIAVLCEYDALPKLGHACGHNLISECGIGAAIAIKAMMEFKDIPGKLVVMGTPAEEGGGGKNSLINSGAFEGIDMSLMVHPGPGNLAHPLTYLALFARTVTFKGQSAHAANYPWEGLNALDAVVQCYSSISCLRQQMKPSWRIHMIITDGGTALNCIPDSAQMKICARALTFGDLKQLQMMIMNSIEAASMASRCQVTVEKGAFSDCKNVISNYELAKTYRKYYEMSGEKFLDDDPHQTLVTSGSTDMGDVTYLMPGIHPKFFIGRQVQCHTEKFAEAAGSQEAQEHVMNAATAIACTVIEAMTDRELFERSVAEHKDSLAKCS